MHALMLAVSVHPEFDPTRHIHHRFIGPHVDYIGVGLASALSWVAVAGPGEAALIAAAIAAARHRVDLPSVILVAWFGAAVGGAVGWLLGRRFGRALMTVPGPLLDRRLRMLRRGDELYASHGLLAVYFAPSWMAGINNMGPVRFLAANSATAAIWAVSIGIGAYAIGPSVTDVLNDIGLVGLVVIGVLVAATLATRRWSRRREPG
jgi:undecaprenyl-diphosphatase